MVIKIHQDQSYKTEHLPIRWKLQKSTAVWSETCANKISKMLKPMISHVFWLYGGGGASGHVVRLKWVKVEPWVHYVGPKQIEVTSKKDFKVTVGLMSLNPKEDAKYAMFGSYSKRGTGFVPHEFTPHLGSWKLAKVVKV